MSETEILFWEVTGLAGLVFLWACYNLARLKYFPPKPEPSPLDHVWYEDEEKRGRWPRFVLEDHPEIFPNYRSADHD